MRVVATDLLDSRLALARRWGARQAVRADATDAMDAIRRAAGKTGLDAAVIAVPSAAALQQAMSLVRGGGKVLLFAHTRRGDVEAIDLCTVCVDEKDLIGVIPRTSPSSARWRGWCSEGSWMCGR